MVSIAVTMILGAALNASAFVGASYIARSVSGDHKHVDEEKIRHDKALEAYQQAMGDFEKKRQAYQDWLTKEYTEKKLADDNLNSTDQGLALYAKAHPDITFDNKEPQFTDYYKKSKKQKQYEMAYVGGGMLAGRYLASKFL